MENKDRGDYEGVKTSIGDIKLKEKVKESIKRERMMKLELEKVKREFKERE